MAPRILLKSWATLQDSRPSASIFFFSGRKAFFFSVCSFMFFPRRGLGFRHVGRAAQHFAKFQQDGVHGEWLVDKGYSRLEYAVLDDSVVGIAGHIERPAYKFPARQLQPQFAAAHPGHDDIRHKQVHRPPALLHKFKRRLGVSGHQHLITAAPQDALPEAAQALLVFHHQNAFMPLSKRLFGGLFAALFVLILRAFFFEREVYGKDGPFSRLAFDRYLAAALLYDAENGG